MFDDKKAIFVNMNSIKLSEMSPGGVESCISQLSQRNFKFVAHVKILE